MLLFVIIILLISLILGLIVLIQNPKGGGLSGTFGSMSSAVMGVKQSTDVMEKGTWTLISVIGGLCVISVMFFQKPQGMDNTNKATQQKSAPAKKGK